jgi:hypothetical protein
MIESQSLALLSIAGIGNANILEIAKCQPSDNEPPWFPQE